MGTNLSCINVAGCKCDHRSRIFLLIRLQTQNTIMSLIQLVYISRATRLMSADDLLDLLEVSRTRNSEAGITGLLVYYGETFMQLLEGDGAPVGALYDVICRDPRNTQNHVLYESKIQVREFADWSMAFVPPDELDTRKIEAFSGFLDPAEDPPECVVRESTARRFMAALRDDIIRRPEHRRV